MLATYFVHFSCYCGTDLYYFGDQPEGGAPLSAMDNFKRSLGAFPFGLFSSADGDQSNCPACKMPVELPSARDFDQITRSCSHLWATCEKSLGV